MAHLQYIHPSALAGGVGNLSGDGGFGGEVDSVSGTREGGLKLWETKYHFQKDMLPNFVGEAFGRKVRPLWSGCMYCNDHYDLDFFHRKKFEFHSVQLP